MVQWSLIIDEDALASVLPDEYVKFARPVADALVVFLEGLAEDRQNTILAEQAALPATVDISQRLAVLAKSCPVLHKLGQVLARDPMLAPELRTQLQQLESLPPSVDHSTIVAVLRSELGPLERLGVELVEPAIAEASVAVVVGYNQAGGRSAERGVFKLLKPGIEQRLAEELDLAAQVGAHLDQRCEELGIPALDYQETFDQVRDKLQWEVRLDQEQQNLRAASRLYSDEPRVHIPALYKHCTPRVTAMEWLPGEKVTDHALDDVDARRSIAAVAVEMLIAKPMFSRDSEMLFHCDPHAGNLMQTDQGRLGILDWSLVGRLTEEQRVALVQVVLAGVMLDPATVVEALERVATSVGDREKLQAVAEESIRQIGRGVLPGLNWMVGMLDRAYQEASLRLGPDLLLFRKTLHTLDGVLHDLHIDAERLDSVLLQNFLQQFIAEWPQRWFALPHWRGFATRLSNFDLARCLMEMPHAAARFWLSQISDHLSATQQSCSTNN
ncbi:AarF/UbiB family protein [Aeoliella sp.]|uniref:AarF/UbiB family protein n=1 Tax=Aeoliella sp. TaxID=2795800 RepID=UPI003CCBC91A